jgi:hypothetical protein
MPGGCHLAAGAKSSNSTSGDGFMRKPLGMLVLVLIVPTSQSGFAPAEKEKAPDYYPLNEGNKWHYKAGGGAVDQKPVTIHLAKIENIDGEKLARVESSVDGKVVATEHLTATDKGVFRHRYNGAVVTPPICVIKLPFKKGDTWETEAKAGDLKIKVACKAGQEEVEVPAGKFNAISIVTEGDLGTVKILTTLWFADGVGMVKQTIEIAGQKKTLELEKYEVAKPK